MNEETENSSPEPRGKILEFPSSQLPDPPHPLRPRCPYCRMDPAQVASLPFQLGPLICLTVFCSNPACRKVLAIFPVDRAAAPEPRIVVPN